MNIFGRVVPVALLISKATSLHWSEASTNTKVKETTAYGLSYLILAFLYLLLCSPELVPQVTGAPRLPGEVTRNVSVKQPPMEGPEIESYFSFNALGED